MGALEEEIQKVVVRKILLILPLFFFRIREREIIPLLLNCKEVKKCKIE
jgi:hypothetical protein